MEYCPEIAILHGAFACIQTESKAGKCDLLHHTKGDRSSRHYGLIRDVVQEITSGPEGPRSRQEEKTWHRRLHHTLFCKAFVFSSRFGSSESGAMGKRRSLAVMRFRAWCQPVPDFHPHLFFELSQEFGWAEFLGEMLAASNLPTALTFITHSLAFCDLDPALLYDLHLLSATLDLLLGLVLCEVAQASWAGACLAAGPASAQRDSGASADGADGGWFPPSPSLSMQEWEGLEKMCRESAVDSIQLSTPSLSMQEWEGLEKMCRESAVDSIHLSTAGSAEGRGRRESEAEGLASNEGEKTRAQTVEATSQLASNEGEKTRTQTVETTSQLASVEGEKTRTQAVEATSQLASNEGEKTRTQTVEATSQLASDEGEKTRTQTFEATSQLASDEGEKTRTQAVEATSQLASNEGEKTRTQTVEATSQLEGLASDEGEKTRAQAVEATSQLEELASDEGEKTRTQTVEATSLLEELASDEGEKTRTQTVEATSQLEELASDEGEKTRAQAVEATSQLEELASDEGKKTRTQTVEATSQLEELVSDEGEKTRTQTVEVTSQLEELASDEGKKTRTLTVEATSQLTSMVDEKTRAQAVEASSQLTSVVDEKTRAQAVEASSQLTSVADKKTRGRVAEATDRLMLDKLLQRVDESAHEHLTHIADLLREGLRMVGRRLSTKLFDRSSCSKGAMATVLPILGHLLGSVMGLCALSLLPRPGHQVARCLESDWLWKEEEPQFGPSSDGFPSRSQAEAPPGERNNTVGSNVDGFSSSRSGTEPTTGERNNTVGSNVDSFSSSRSGTKPSTGERNNTIGSNVDGFSLSRSQTEPSPRSDRNVFLSLVAGALVALLRVPPTRTACVECLRSFFAVQTQAKGVGSPPSSSSSLSCRLSAEKAVKFGRVLKLNLQLCRLPTPLRTVRLVQSLVQLMAGEDTDEEGDDDDDDEARMELRRCVSSIGAEFQRRERAAEEKRRNPSLVEVMDKVQKRLPRWEWYLQYGLTKRDVNGWWLAGFLEFLLQQGTVLRKESDLKHLLSVLRLLSHAEHQSRHAGMFAQLISCTFSQLPTSVQEQVLLETSGDDQWSGFLPASSDFIQALTVSFNKLSATASRKNMCDILPLALHDLLTFTHHAISTTIASEGQIPVIVKVLGMIPAVLCSSAPPPLQSSHHDPISLLCGCVRAVLHTRRLDAKEQKNCLRLVSALLKPVELADPSQHPPLLGAGQFLSSCVLPYITLDHAPESPPPISTEFALRLLIGCLEATLCVGSSDWLREVTVPVVVACLSATLQASVGMMVMGEDRGVELKTLVLDAVSGLLLHLSAVSSSSSPSPSSGDEHRGFPIEGEGLSWLQERCCDQDWTVCAYLAPFLAPTDSVESNSLIAGYAAEAVKSAAGGGGGDLSAVLLLSAVSDSAARQVTRSLPEVDVHVPQVFLTIALAQVLPALLVREAHRVVQVLTVLVDSGCVRMDLHHPSLLHGSALHSSGGETAEVVCGLLTEAVLVVVCQEHRFTDTLLHHLSSILVAALQWLLEGPEQNREAERPRWDRSGLKVVVFHQVCALMSVSPAVMVDPLFVVLLDLLSSFSPSELESESQVTQAPKKLRDVLVRGMAWIPADSFRDTLLKKLNHQSV